MDPTLLQSKVFLIACAAVVVVAGLGLINAVIASIWHLRGKDFGSKLEFKYLYPLQIKPEGEYPFLLFISTLATGDPTPDQLPDVVEETIRRQVERLLDHNRDYYRENNTKSTRLIQKKTHLKFEIEAKGLTFDPVGTTRLHRDELVIQHFQVSADKSLEGEAVRGVFKVSSGWFKVAEFGFEIEVTSKALCEPFKTITAPIRRDIFPSYAREDAGYLEEFKKYFKVFGDDYISDQIIRTGTLWEQEIKALINRADLFQLFWTRNAAESDYIPIELNYALSLNRPGFIYQTVCESEAPPPPLQGKDIQIVYVSLTRKKEKKDKNRKAFLFAPMMAATGSTANAAVPVLTAVGGVMALSVAIGLGTHWGIERATRPGPGPGPNPAPTETPSVERPSPPPDSNRDTPPPPSAPVTGQVLASNEGVAGLEVMLCAQGQTPTLKPTCTSTKTDRSGSFSFPTVDKALKYYVVVQSKDWTCDPPRQALSDFSVPQNVRFVCKKTETPSPSPSPSPSARPAAQADIRVDTKLDHEPKKQGERARVTVYVKNVGTGAARNVIITTQLPEYVISRTSTPQAKRSQTQSGHLLLEQFLSTVAAGEAQELTIDIFLTRDLKANERVWIERWPPKYDK